MNKLRLSAFFGALFLLLLTGLTATSLAQTAHNKTPFDFDGDGKTDFVVWRPETAVWYILKSADGTVSTPQYGIKTDKIVPGDYDGDDKADVAVFRISSGTWYVWKSSGGIVQFDWGVAGDIPVPADYDGDGITDAAVFRPSDGVWYVQKSNGGTINQPFGNPLSDIPIRGDFDGDDKADIAVWRPSTGTWLWKKSSNGEEASENWGLGSLGDTVGAGDYDGDNKTDFAVWRSSNGTWYVKKSMGGEIAWQWGSGSNGDVPVPGDYDGDAKTDLAVWRTNNGNWYIRKSSDNSPYTVQWGSQSAGDKLAPAAFIPTGAIVGKVTRADNGANIGGALLEVTEQGKFKVAVVTDSLGNFSATGLLTGTYEVKVSALTYKDAQFTSINVVAGETTTNNVALAPERDVRYLDNFNVDGNFSNSTNFNVGLLPGGTPAPSPEINVRAANQRLEMSFDGTTNPAVKFRGIVTKNAQNFTNSSVIVEVRQLGVGNVSPTPSFKDNVRTRIEIGSPLPANNQNADKDKFLIEFAGNTPSCRRVSEESDTNLTNFTYSDVLTRFLRIRHIASTVPGNPGKIIFESSPTGLDGTWTKIIDTPASSTPGWLENAYASVNIGKVGATCNSTGPCNNPLSALDNFRFVGNSTVTAKAGDDKVVTVNTSPTLAGTAEGSPTSYKWTFTGKPSGAPDPTITSPTGANTSIGNLSFAGEYQFQLTVSDGNGSVSTDEVRIRVVEAPTATIIAPVTALEDEPIVFDGTMSVGGYEYEWDFGDGYKAELAKATHVYQKPGTYTNGIKLRKS